MNSKKKMIAVGLVLTVFSFLIQVITPVFAQADVSKSVTYLQANPNNPWVTMALAAAGQNPDVSYLKNFSRTSATDYESSILALTSTGQNPSTYASEDLIAKLRTFEQQNQIGDVALLNDDIFGILALKSSGVASSDSLVNNSVQFLLSKQLPNGGWGYAVNAGSDTNSTAAAVMALIAYGKSPSDPAVAKAVAYLKSTQNTDGGFPYDPSQSFSSVSDSSSDAWVISALYAAGEQPSLIHLQSLIDETGYAHYVGGDTPTSFTPTATAYAVVALSGKYYPVNTLSAQQPAGVEVNYLIKGSGGILCTGKITAVTALDVVKNSASVCGFTYVIKDTSFGAYLQQIGKDAAAGSSGWLYAVNGKEPSVGSGDYPLVAHDGVIWFFGPFDSAIPTMPTTSGVDLSATIVPSDTPVDSVGLEVDVRSLAFGSLKPGSIGQAKFALKNIGSQPIQIAGSVTGDELFRSYLQLDDSPWRQFALTLATNQQSTIQAKLPIPATYSVTGSKTGVLTFWATAAN